MTETLMNLMDALTIVLLTLQTIGNALRMLILINLPVINAEMATMTQKLRFVMTMGTILQMDASQTVSQLLPAIIVPLILVILLNVSLVKMDFGQSQKDAMTEEPHTDSQKDAAPLVR